MKGSAQGPVEAEAGWGGCGVSEPMAGSLAGEGFLPLWPSKMSWGPHTQQIEL